MVCLLIPLFFIPWWGASTAPAAGLSSTVFLSETAARRVGVESLEAVYEDEAPASGGENPGPREAGLARLTVYYGKPDRIRINVTWPDREEVFLSVGGETLALAGDQAVEASWPVPAVLFRLLLETDPGNLERLLATRLDLRAIRNQDGRVILGTSSGTGPRGWAWFSHPAGELTRLSVTETNPAGRYDLALSDYQTLGPGIEWPGRLELFRSPGGPKVWSLRSLAINPDLGGDSFNLDDSSPAAAPPPNRRAGRNPDLKKIREMMDWFKKKLE
ncbi:MAG: hypothetical protein V1816_10235 [Pseudomonadota bacterium]